ncbi:hypothetical protein V6N13_053423 [Hibiscus sabdariffa]
MGGENFDMDSFDMPYHSKDRDKERNSEEHCPSLFQTPEIQLESVAKKETPTYVMDREGKQSQKCTALAFKTQPSPLCLQPPFRSSTTKTFRPPALSFCPAVSSASLPHSLVLGSVGVAVESFCRRCRSLLLLLLSSCADVSNRPWEVAAAVGVSWNPSLCAKG